jgi:VWFA-related protein
MIRAVLRLGVLLAMGAAPVVATQSPVFRSGSATVSLFATVTDPSGRLASGLRADDFVVYDNGVRQPLTVFADDPQPISVVVMLDRSESMTEHRRLVTDAVSAFVGQLERGDRARIGSFADRIRIAPASFTDDVRELRRVLRESLEDGEDTPLWNATAAALDALRPEVGRRRVVLLFTDGKDNPGEAIAADDYVSLPVLRTRIEAEETMVYGVGLTGDCRFVSPPGRFLGLRDQGGPRLPPPSWPRPAPPGPTPRRPPSGPIPQPPAGPREPADADPACAAERPAPYVRELAEMGGGGYFELDSSAKLEATFAAIADELHHQYMLGFSPTATDKARHTLQVAVTRPGYRVRARKSYVSGEVTK